MCAYKRLTSKNALASPYRFKYVIWAFTYILGTIYFSLAQDISEIKAPDIIVHTSDTLPLQDIGSVSKPFEAAAKDILASAGTYGDFSRYLQLFPGVVFNDDESDDIWFVVETQSKIFF